MRRAEALFVCATSGERFSAVHGKKDKRNPWNRGRSPFAANASIPMVWPALPCGLAEVFGKSEMTNLEEKHEAGNLTEREAIARAKDGDSTAFECLYQLHCRRVYRLCLRMTRNSAEAEDLAQQAFLQVFRKIATFRGESGFSTWLHRVTVNTVLLYLRSRKPTEILFEDLEHHGEGGEGRREHGSSDLSMLGALDRLNLIRAIRKLPQGCKQNFLLYDVLGYKHSEIGVLLGCSTGCSKSQLHKARRRLRRLLQGEEETAEACVASA